MSSLTAGSHSIILILVLNKNVDLDFSTENIRPIMAIIGRPSNDGHYWPKDVKAYFITKNIVALDGI
jgi:hypothetical protein